MGCWTPVGRASPSALTRPRLRCHVGQFTLSTTGDPHARPRRPRRSLGRCSRSRPARPARRSADPRRATSTTPRPPSSPATPTAGRRHLGQAPVQRARPLALPYGRESVRGTTTWTNLETAAFTVDRPLPRRHDHRPDVAAPSPSSITPRAAPGLRQRPEPSSRTPAPVVRHSNQLQRHPSPRTTSPCPSSARESGRNDTRAGTSATTSSSAPPDSRSAPPGPETGSVAPPPGAPRSQSSRREGRPTVAAIRARRR